MYSWKTAAVQSAFGVEQTLSLVLLHRLDQCVVAQQPGAQQAVEAAPASSSGDSSLDVVTVAPLPGQARCTSPLCWG